jgi:O-antigen/teichoic acid export membrane protein
VGWITVVRPVKDADESPEALYTSFAEAPVSTSPTPADTIRAAGLGLAAALEALLALVFTVAMARLLGPDEYGSLAALVAAFLILAVAGTGLQTTVAREIGWQSASGALPTRSSVRRWSGALILVVLGLLVISAVSRDLLAAVIGVDQEWAACVIVSAAGLWLLISFQRGVLLGARRYRVVGLSMIGETAGWLMLGGAAAFAGLGVTGAILGIAAAEIFVALLLQRTLGGCTSIDPQPAAGRFGFGHVFRSAAVPMVALVLFAFLLNVDVIAVKHLAAREAAASSYAAASVAAKLVVWLAIGVGLYLLPEAARRVGEGLDGRGVLKRALGVLAAAAVPIILLYALAGRFLLETVFGSDLASAAGALSLLGVAMTLLAVTYLTVQYQLALRRRTFLFLLAAAALIEPVLLWIVGGQFVQIALALVGLQLLLGLCQIGLALAPSSQAGCLPDFKH